MLVPIFLLLSTIACFSPTDEWQLVGEAENVPPGLEVRLDFDTGERYARLPQSSQSSATTASIASAGSEIQVRPVEGDLAKLEELAHDIDRGAEIIQNSFMSLRTLMKTDDAAARVIQIALRHNPYAAQSLLRADPEFPKFLVGDPQACTWRKLSIYGSLISSKFGYDSCLPYTQYLRDNLSRLPWEPKTLSRLEGILEDIYHLDPSALGDWIFSLETVIPNADLNPTVQLHLLQVLTFAVSMHDKPPVSHSAAFMEWLARQTTSQASSKDLQEYTKKIRHSVFGNPMAERNHMDL